jgi:DNA-binding response OmpR family regulator
MSRNLKAGTPVLIVEDESLIRWTLRHYLIQAGVSVQEADTGAVALDFLRRDRICGILLDLRLPDMDGMEILRKVRQTHPDCPVWIMTAHGTPKIEAEAAALGVKEFLHKPFDAKALAERIAAALGI